MSSEEYMKTVNWDEGCAEWNDIKRAFEAGSSGQYAKGWNDAMRKQSEEWRKMGNVNNHMNEALHMIANDNGIRKSLDDYTTALNSKIRIARAALEQKRDAD